MMGVGADAGWARLRRREEEEDEDMVMLFRERIGTADMSICDAIRVRRDVAQPLAGALLMV
jgi:hypothetical protein